MEIENARETLPGEWFVQRNDILRVGPKPVGCARSGYAGEKNRHFHRTDIERRSETYCIGLGVTSRERPA